MLLKQSSKIVETNIIFQDDASQHFSQHFQAVTKIGMSKPYKFVCGFHTCFNGP